MESTIKDSTSADTVVGRIPDLRSELNLRTGKTEDWFGSRRGHRNVPHLTGVESFGLDFYKTTVLGEVYESVEM